MIDDITLGGATDTNVTGEGERGDGLEVETRKRWRRWRRWKRWTASPVGRGEGEEEK